MKRAGTSWAASLFAGTIFTLLAACSPARADEAACAALKLERDRVICADPQLRIEMKGLRRLETAYADREPFVTPWDATPPDRCTTHECVTRQLRDQMMEYTAGGFSPAGGLRYEAELPDPLSSSLWLFELDDGWTLFVVLGSYLYGPPGEMLANSGGAVGVVRLADGAGTYRADDGTGFDFRRVNARTWRVDQVGDCACGAHVRLGGTYRFSTRTD